MYRVVAIGGPVGGLCARFAERQTRVRLLERVAREDRRADIVPGRGV
jgi:hypothetical protein